MVVDNRCLDREDVTVGDRFIYRCVRWRDESLNLGLGLEWTDVDEPPRIPVWDLDGRFLRTLCINGREVRVVRSLPNFVHNLFG